MLRRWWMLCLSLLFVMPLMAQDVPPPLRDWQAWVLHDMPQHDCPFLSNQFPSADSRQCAWPGRLTLNAGENGAQFSLNVHVDAPSWVTLPGDERTWPQGVTVNNQPAVVLQHAGQPMLRLSPGDYQLHGNLPWSTRPARLRVPATIGLVTLNVDGVAVTRIERDGDQLTLGEAAAAQRSVDALSLRVYRRLQDGLPAMLETQLQFNVTGSAREQLLGPVLPTGFVATALSGDLPAKLESDGRLRVQLRPGQWTLTLEARDIGTLDKVVVTLPAAPWPRQEIWSYADDSALRITHAEGEAVDAAQAGVPDDWAELPAYALDDAAGLSIAQGSRGDEGGQGDQLHLRRQLWLDFDGTGITVADNLTGELRHHQRLDVALPWQLQHADQQGVPLLITQGANGSSGVELREQHLDLHAGLRLPERGRAWPSSGWQIPLEGIDATLHLPHGYRLLGARGVDRSPDSWVAQWSLLDLFVVALIALLAGRLLGWPWAVLAAAFLALAQHEGGAPCWTLALALALGLLMRVLPEGRLRSWARAGVMGAFLLAVLWALPFAATQLQDALHPQLERTHHEQIVRVNYIEPEPRQQAAAYAPMPPPPRVMQAIAPPPAPAPPSMPENLAVNAAPESTVMGGKLASKALSSVAVTASAISLTELASNDQGSRALIQAGAGTPNWDEGNDYQLGWSGPVTPQQTTRLFIAPAWLVRLLRVVMTGLLFTLLAKLALVLTTPWRNRLRNWRGSSAFGATLLLLALLPHGVHAQSLPNQELLTQLRQRLTEAPKCVPACAELAQAQLQVKGDALDVALEAHVGTLVALPLPRASDALQLVDATVDGHPDAALVHGNGQLLLRLDRGVHRIGLHYRIGAADSGSLQFALPPQRVTFNGQGWSLEGVDDGRMLGDSVTLRRVQAASNGGAPPSVQSFPSYVRLTRSIGLGVDWFVDNRVERIAPKSDGFSITLPLLPGEHPLGDHALVKDGRISVTFKAGQNVVSWHSRLDHTTQLSLHAPTLGERAEVWRIGAAPMWHVDVKGVPTSASEEDLVFQPMPGETLHLAISQPAAIAGDSLAFDNVSLTSETGQRASELTLDLHARSTRGGEHAIHLPAGSELLGAQRDGTDISLAVRDDKLNLPLLPGAHDYSLRLREPQGLATRLHTPVFDLHAPAANIDLALQLPQDRWVLWTWGPTSGPAVLYWSQLIVLLLVAWLLARYAPTPLRFWQWLLLGLGFSAFAWSAYALVAVWLILLGLRARHTRSKQMGVVNFNLMQFGLAALSVWAMAVLIVAIPNGLLGLPNMHVAGNGSTAWQLHWFADRSAGVMPSGGVFSVSLWVYKLAMLAWALWLANALIGWLRWGFEAWTLDGYWRKREPMASPMPPSLREATPGSSQDA